MRPFRFPQGTILTIYLAQNHGGRGGDDDSNNLGRFRLSITNAPGATADPLPKDVRDILSIPAGEAYSPAGADGFWLLAHHGSGVESGKR